MKKINIKSTLLGFVAGALCVSTVYAGGVMFSVSESKMNLKMNGEVIPFNHAILSIKKDSKGPAVNYVPLNDLLAFMNMKGTLAKDGKTIEIGIYSNFQMNSTGFVYEKNYISPDEYAASDKILKNMTQEDADGTALELIQMTGNWSYVELYLPLMSKKGIDEVVKIYNSKHSNKSEHKNAADYYKK